MAAKTLAIDRWAPTRRPHAPATGYHRWTHLLFLHWRVPAETLQPLLPEGLTVDTFDGSGWIGLVLFDLSGVRPWWFPAVPGISRFHETNVRTYVHCGGEDPGVWFFSLDASRSLPVRIARWKWHLAYFRAEMEMNCSGRHLFYRSRRLWPEPTPAECRVSAEFGDWLDGGPELPPGCAAPGTLEHFLVERYILYAHDDRRGLYRGRVHHPAYRLRTARVEEICETLTRAAGVSISGPPEHAAYSPGVDVEVFALKRLGGGSGSPTSEVGVA